MLDRQPTYGNVVRSYQHPEKGSKLIAGTSPTPKTRFLSRNRTQSRVVTGFLTVHNTLTKHLYLITLTNSPLCRGCGAEEETSVYVLCESEALALLTHAHLGSLFLEPRGRNSLSLGAIQGCRNRAPMTWYQIMGTTGLSKA